MSSTTQELVRPLQLATEIRSELHFYLNNPDWVMQQKFDGHRTGILIQPNESFLISRTGSLTLIGRPNDVFDPLLDYFCERSGGGNWLFDSEYVNSGEIAIFDIIQAPLALTKGKPIRKFPLRERQKLLSAAFRDYPHPSPFVVENISGDHRKALNAIAASRGEGVVFKNLNAAYSSAKETKDWVKYKFVKEVDCVVIETRFDTDHDGALLKSFELGVYETNERGLQQFRQVGACSSLTGDGPNVKVGDVVTVQILYVTESLRLYQPVKARIRTDKQPEDCTIEQLYPYITNKEYVYNGNQDSN